MFLNEGAKDDPSSKTSGSRCDNVYLVIPLMKIPKCFDNRHHIFPDNLFTIYTVAAYVLRRQAPF